VFIQIIQGRCTRPDELHALADRWREELGPTADGWLGGTYGFTDDDTFLGIVRFESREAAMRNSERPEQQEWAKQMTALVDGDMEYHDCDDVTLLMGGGSDDAGFVQVMRGRLVDPDRIKAMMTDRAEELREARPEILGATLAVEDDGMFTETIAFTDEASARRGEKQEMPDEVRQALESAMEDVSYLDLHRPWFSSPS
jgi:hypothetical protein